MYIEENKNNLVTYGEADHVLVYSAENKIILFGPIENKLYSTSPNKIFIGTKEECENEIKTLGLIN
jgi:hypothetical protein